MGGNVNLHPAGSPNNGFARMNSDAAYYELTIADSRPANSSITYTHIEGPGNVTGEVSWSGTTVRWNRSGGTFYGGASGTGYTVYAKTSGGGTPARTPNSWTGGMGGYVSWAYNAPGAPNAPTVSRTANGTSITATTGGGSGAISYYKVKLDSGTWFANGTAFNSLGAHQTYTVYGLAGNDDASTQSTGVTSYGIPKAPVNVSITRSSLVSGRIDGSWSAPDYVGQSINKYVVKRTDTVTNVVTTIVDSNVTSFTDTGLVRGRLYSYEIYIIGNGSPGNGLSATVTGVMAPGVPSAPVPYTPQNPIQISKVGRNVTVSCNQSVSDYGNAISGYRVQYSTDDGLTWSSATSMVNRSHMYELLPAALTYIFRCFAVNSIGNGETTSSVPTFVSAGGRRKLVDGDFEPTQTAKRYDSTRPEGQRWVDLNTAKRYSSAANGGLGGWIDLS